MSHGIDGGHSSGAPHGVGGHEGGTHSGGLHSDLHGSVSHSAMHAAMHSISSAQGHYGNHSVVFASGLGILSGGHVINTVSGAGAHYGTAMHIDGPGANRQNPKDLRIEDIKGARLLVAHALGIRDRGCGDIAYLLDDIAYRIGLKRIDNRPNLKGEDNQGLDGIMGWNAWGNQQVKPDGWLPLIHGLTDRHIHIFAIPTWGKVNGEKKLIVRPDEVVTLTVRITHWHYRETRDAEVKIEAIVNSQYVSDPFQGGYTFYGRRTSAIEVKSLELLQKLFAEITSEGEKADPKYRVEFLKRVNSLPHRKGRNRIVPDDEHETGVYEGSAADAKEVQDEDVASIKNSDRDSENQVAGGAANPPPATPTAGGFDDDGLIDAEASPAAVVVGPAATPPATPATAPMAVTGTYVIPVNLKK